MLSSRIENYSQCLVIILLITSVVSQQSCIPPFQCLSSNTYQMLGSVFTCQAGMVCNADYDNTCAP